MIYGDIFHVLPEGVEIPQGQLNTLGIFEDTQLYGYFIPASKKETTLNPETKKFPDLLITPLNPELWPFIARLQIMLKHEQGNLVYISNWLANNHNINVLYAEATRSGRSHACWNLVVRMTSIYNDQKDNLQKLQREKEIDIDRKEPFPDELIEISVNIDEYINRTILNEIINDDNIKKRLHLSRFPLDEKIRLQERAFSGWPIKTLRYFYNYYHRQVAQFNLTYCNGLIKFENDFWKKVPSEPNYRVTKKNCHLAIASFNSEDCTIRLLLLPNKFSDRMFRISIPYERDCDLNCGKMSTEGLMSFMAESLSDKKILGMDFWKVYSKTIEDTRTVEKGTIEFLGSISEDIYEEKKDKMHNQSFVDEIAKNTEINFKKNDGDKDVTIKDINIDNLKMAKIFVSYNQIKRFEKELLPLIIKASEELGIDKDNLLIVDKPIDRQINQKIIENARACNFGIQFCLFNPSRTLGAYTWIDSEYNLLELQKKKCARFVEKDLAGKNPLKYWRDNLKSFDGKGLYLFSSKNRDDVKKDVKKVINELLQEYYSQI